MPQSIAPTFDSICTSIQSCIRNEYGFKKVGFSLSGEDLTFKINLSRCSTSDLGLLQAVLVKVFDPQNTRWNEEKNKLYITGHVPTTADLNNLRLAFESTLYPVARRAAVLAPQVVADSEEYDLENLYERIPAMDDEEIMRAAFYSAKKVTGLPVVFIIGASGDGKSTMINHLLGSDLVRQRIEGTSRDAAVVVPGHQTYSEIGHNPMNSQTFAPVIVKQIDANGTTTKAFVDFAGFGDSRIWSQENPEIKAKYTKYFNNTYRLISELASKVDSIIIAISYETITQETLGRHGENKLDSLMQNVTSCIGNLPTDEIKDNIITVVTKLPDTKATLTECNQNIVNGISRLYQMYDGPRSPKVQLLNLVRESKIIAYDVFAAYTDRGDVRNTLSAELTKAAANPIDMKYFRTISTYDFMNTFETLYHKLFTELQHEIKLKATLEQLVTDSRKGVDESTTLESKIKGELIEIESLKKSSPEVKDKKFSVMRGSFSAPNDPILLKDFKFTEWKSDEVSIFYTSGEMLARRAALVGGVALVGGGLALFAGFNLFVVLTAPASVAFVSAVAMAPFAGGGLTAAAALPGSIGMGLLAGLGGGGAIAHAASDLWDFTPDQSFDVLDVKNVEAGDGWNCEVDLAPARGTIASVKITFTINPEDNQTIQRQIAMSLERIKDYQQKLLALKDGGTTPQQRLQQNQSELKRVDHAIKLLEQRYTFFTKILASSVFLKMQVTKPQAIAEAVVPTQPAVRMLTASASTVLEADAVEKTADLRSSPV